MKERLLDAVDKFSAWQRILCFILGLALIAFFGIADYLTGAELSASILYLIPITLVALFSGPHYGLVSAFLSAVAWFMADVLAGSQYSRMLIPYWNAAVHLGYFMLHSTLFSTLLRFIREQRHFSMTDPLTGAANWRYFEDYAHRIMERDRRAHQPLTLAYFDLDDFKRVNDTLGHGVGNELLTRMTEIITSHLRPADIFSRLGGDEFAVLLSSTDYEGATVVLERIRDAVATEMRSRGWPITMSIGAITYMVLPSSIVPMLKQVDDLMYTVKESGKDGIRHISWPPETSTQPA